MSNPDFTRRSLSTGAKVIIEDEVNEDRPAKLQHFQKEGQMFRITTANLWGKALTQLPEEHMHFALNSAVDTLPHNVNLCLWKRRGSEACPLCRERQTLIHVLNMCPVAMTSRRFNFRHDAVLQKIPCPFFHILGCDGIRCFSTHKIGSSSIVSSHDKHGYTPALYIFSFCLLVRGRKLTQSSILWRFDSRICLELATLCGTSILMLRNFTDSEAR